MEQSSGDLSAIARLLVSLHCYLNRHRNWHAPCWQSNAWNLCVS